MQQQDPHAIFRDLIALADSIREKLELEHRRFPLTGEMTPLLRSCLSRSRGHLELAQQALSQTRADGGTGPQALLDEVTTKGSLRLDPDGEKAELKLVPPAEARFGQTVKSDAWVQGRVDEISAALERALGETAVVRRRSATAPASSEDGREPPAPQFSGQTDTLSVPDLIGFFQVQSKSGVLEIEGEDETFRLEFHLGSLIHAASSSSPESERLGAILLRHGALDEEELDECLDHLASGERLGQALRREEWVTPEQLARALEEQVLGIFVRLMELSRGRFTFHEALPGDDPVGQVRYNVTALLLESARQVDEERELRESA